MVFTQGARGAAGHAALLGHRRLPGQLLSSVTATWPLRRLLRLAAALPTLAPSTALLLAATMTTAGCAAVNSVAVVEYLDPQTAITVRTVAAPSVYGRDVPELAVNARDYLSLGAVELNNMGKRQLFLVVLAWTTVDRTGTGIAAPPLAERVLLRLRSGDRQLSEPTHEPRRLGAGEPLFRPAGRYLGESWYRVTLADLKALVAAGPDSRIELLDEAGNRVYQLWRDASAALAEFVRDIPDLAPGVPAPR